MSSKGKSPSSKPAHGAKAAFVRAQPASMKATEVVAAAKTRGLSMTPMYVYKIRAAKPKGKAIKRAGKPAVVAAPKAKAGAFAGTKKDFVLANPTMSVKELVDAAGKAGVKLTANYVYIIRSSRSGQGRGGARAAFKSVAAPEVSGKFVELVAQLGLQQAQALLDATKARFAAVRV